MSATGTLEERRGANARQREKSTKSTRAESAQDPSLKKSRQEKPSPHFVPVKPKVLWHKRAVTCACPSFSLTSFR